jgi:signal transduction histidine kinase
MNLKPGHYRFQVIASNNDGVWNTNGDRLEFTIRPAFFQTLWFQALSIGLAILLVWFGLWLRVRYVAAEIEARLSERQAERMRIARELHDTLLQGFQGLLMRFQVVADAIPKRSRAKPMMEVVLNRAEDVLTEGRDRVHDLRSVDAHASPLMEALRRLADGLELDGCGPINFRCVGVQRVVDDNAQKEILAIAKEALSNCCRHAQAPTIECCLIFTPWHVRLVCEDTGIGIDAGTLSAGGRPGHWGLTGMRERARQAGGGLTIHSQPGRTRVEFKLNTRVARLKSALQQLSNLGRS